MCLAIYKPKGTVIERDSLANAFSNNNDGAGFAIAKGGQLRIYKGFFNFHDFWKAWKKHEDDDAIIHFRMATHGAENKKNCHPFMLCEGEYALIHNGVLPISTKADLSKSDTYHFAELILTPMLRHVDFDDPSFKWLVEVAIGNYNKLVILRADGSYCIYNEEEGHWHDGAWYSNHSYSYSTWGYSGYGGYCNHSSRRGHWSDDYHPATSGFGKIWTPEGEKDAYMTDEEIKEYFPDFERIKTQAELDADNWLEEKEAEHEAELQQAAEREAEERRTIQEIQEMEGEWE